ncbi:MAG: bifunctional aspartate kinase/homoserine dehydrogenase II [Arsenophonus sp.]
MTIIKSGSVKYHNRQLHKFGGSSLSNVECYKQVANIMVNYSQPGDLMIVSSSGTTTNQLINWLKLSQTDHILSNHMQKSICKHQEDLIVGLVSEKKANILKLAFLADIERLIELLNKPIYNDIYAEIVGHGEIWSARLMSVVLEEYGLSNHWLDSRLFLRAEFSAQPKVNETLSFPLLQDLLQKYPNKLLVVTGFIAQSKDGKTVLLGRNGSDYSATQIGALAGVNKVTIWSDVAGIYSADPNKVKDAYLLPLLGLDEASELARLAAPVIHARTLQPISITNIDLQFKCSYNPEKGSTKIERVLKSCNGVKIVTSHDDVCLIELNLTNKQNFKKTYKNIDLFLKNIQLRPLATGLHQDRKLIQLCYTSEIVDSALNILKETIIVEKILLRDRFSLIALVGSGVCKNTVHNYIFHKELKDQFVEFIWHSEEKISLVAVLSTTKILDLVQRLHRHLFQKTKTIKCVLFCKSNISFNYLKSFFIEKKNIFTCSDFKLIFLYILNKFRRLIT